MGLWDQSKVSDNQTLGIGYPANRIIKLHQNFTRKSFLTGFEFRDVNNCRVIIHRAK